MAKPNYIEFPTGLQIPILFEDRVAIAIDKPAGWLCAPSEWDLTGRNLQLAIESSICAGDYWASSRRLQYLRFVHRLDAGTSGVLVLARSPGGLKSLSALFEERAVTKVYLAVVEGVPRETEWTCSLPLGQVPGQRGRMQVDPRTGRPAETAFRVRATAGGRTLVEARPLTGRTHQIRVHLAQAGCTVVGDAIYGTGRDDNHLALRAVRVEYPDPFQRRLIWIAAPTRAFCIAHGFAGDIAVDLERRLPPGRQLPKPPTPVARHPDYPEDD